MNQQNKATSVEEKSRTIRTSMGSRTVITNEQDGIYRSRLYVNCSGTDLGSATLVARKHTSRSGALAWASKVLAS